jgi:hypothetical protein
MDRTQLINALNGSVQSQGVKVDAPGWLDMSSKEWINTPDKAKATAYQAAKVTGWTDKALLNLMIQKPVITEVEAKITLEFLQDLEKKFPIPVESILEFPQYSQETKYFLNVYRIENGELESCGKFMIEDNKTWEKAFECTLEEGKTMDITDLSPNPNSPNLSKEFLIKSCTNKDVDLKNYKYTVECRNVLLEK